MSMLAWTLGSYARLRTKADNLASRCHLRRMSLLDLTPNALTDQLLTLTHTSIEYITKRTAFEQASAAVPRTLASENTAPPQVYNGEFGHGFSPSECRRDTGSQARKVADCPAAAIQTFVADIISRSKDIELLIAALPKKDDSGARVSFSTEARGTES
jgi:hypothetical protein